MVHPTIVWVPMKKINKIKVLPVDGDLGNLCQPRSGARAHYVCAHYVLRAYVRVLRARAYYVMRVMRAHVRTRKG